MQDTLEQIADNIEQSLQQGFDNTFVTWRDSDVFTADDIVLYITTGKDRSKAPQKFCITISEVQ